MLSPAKIKFKWFLVTPKMGGETLRNAASSKRFGLSSDSGERVMDSTLVTLIAARQKGHASYNGGLDVAPKVLKSEGIRLLYRGFSLSVLTYSPSSAVWWASYGSSQRFIWSRLLDNGTEHGGPAPSQGKIVAVQAAGGIIAGATASCITTPLDTIKTRLQVMRHDKRPTARQVVKQLIVEDGWTAFYRGLGPRFVSVVTSMILAYEPPDDSSCSRVFILVPYSFGAGDI